MGNVSGRLGSDEQTYFTAHSLAQLDVEGRVGLGQRLRQVFEIVGMAEMMACIRQDSGYSLRQRFLLIAQDSQDRPWQMAQRFKKGLEGDLIEATQPPTTQGQTVQEFTDEPQLRLTTFRSQPVESNDQAPILAGRIFSISWGNSR